MNVARKAFAALGAAALVASLAGCSLAQAWGDKVVEKISPEHVEAMYDKVTRAWTGLTASADNACLMQNSDGEGLDTTFVESPAAAYIAKYRSQVAEYNAAMVNIFEAGVVAPVGYPRSVPNFEETTGENPDYCGVSTRLAELKAASEADI